jgi:hypothetical protein
LEALSLAEGVVMLEAVVGHSGAVETEEAISWVIAQCGGALGPRHPRAGLLFAASQHDPERLLAAVNARCPNLHLIGCTTDGEMSAAAGFTEDGVTLALFVSDEIEMGVGIGLNASADPEGAARTAVDMARAGMRGPTALAVTLPDGMTANARRVLGALSKLIGPGVPIVGGMSADTVTPDKKEFLTRQFCEGRTYTDAVPVLLFGGPLRLAVGIASGWSLLGRRMRVSRADGAVVHEIDGQPAMEMYHHYLGPILRENIAGLGAYPLAVFEAGTDLYYLRVPAGAEADAGSIRFLADVPEGSEVQITQAVRHDVIDGVGRAVSDAVARYPGQHPSAAMLFSCTGRKLVLGTQTRREAELVRECLPVGLPFCGFYTFGEIGPLSPYTEPRYHNTTFVTLVMGTS